MVVALSVSAVAAPSAQADSTGGITGVVAGAGDSPLGGISVTAYQATGSGTWAWVSQATTGSDGSYSISGLSAGTYRLEFYDPSGIYPSEYYDNVSTLDFDSANDIVVAAGATTSGVDTTLPVGGHITGTVTDSHHVGIGGFEIFVFDAGMNVNIGWTDPAGNYDVGGLATGTYRVEFNDYTNDILTQFYNDEPSLGQADGVAVTAGETTANINATLAGEATVSGTITDATTGNPISYAHVDFQPLNVPVGTGVCTATTDANGDYTCSMPGGQYLVHFEASSYQDLYYDGSKTEIGATTLTVSADQIVSDLNVQLTMLPTTVDGITADMDGTVVPGISVEVVRADDGTVLAQTTSDSSGKYDFVLSGLYPEAPVWQPVSLRVRFSDPNGVYATQLSDPFSVTPGSDSSPECSLVAIQAGEVKGRTLDWDGTPLPGVSVAVVTSTGTPVGSGTSDAGGDYDIAGLPVALHTHYDVRFSDPSGVHQDQELSGLLVLPGTAETVDSSLPAKGATSIGADGDWVWEYPAHPSSDLSGVSAGDDDHLWAVGVHGTILKSVDAGASWHPVLSGVMTDFDAVAAIGATDAWAVGSGGAILATTDGGLHWATQDSTVGQELYAVHFADASHGWAVGLGGTIVATTNGGVTWTQQQSGVVYPLLSVTFTDALHGWAAGAYGVVLITSDGGQHWTKQTAGTSDSLTGITMPDGQHGWASTDGGQVLFTTNGGVSWTVQETWTDHPYVAASASDANHCCVLDEDGHTLYTSDGGAHWYAAWPNGLSWAGIARSPSGQLWAVGAAGTIMQSADGNLWTGIGGVLVGPFDFNAVSFSDDQHGWALADHGNTWSTADGGTSWVQSAGPGGSLAALSTPDASHTWVVGSSGQISCTTDGGETWLQQTSGTSETLAGVSFPDATHGWVVGYAGTILATSDGGAMWAPQASDTTADLTAVSFADDKHGVAVGYLGTVVMTTDGGQTWTSEFSGTTDTLCAVSCPDATHAWAVGDGYSVTIASSDGYRSWKVREDVGYDYAVSFADAEHGWLAGQSGIYATTDGGSTWTLQTQHCEGFLGISAPDPSHCWAVGDAIMALSWVAPDTTPPAGTMNIDGGAAVTASTTATIDSAVVDTSGSAFMKFSTNDGDTWGSWQKYGATATVTLPAGSGTKTVLGDYEDGAGNVATMSSTITLSTDAPTVAVSGAANGAWLSHGVTLNFTATASPLSGGVASVTVDCDGAVSTNPGGTASVAVPVLPNGTHTVTYHATDDLGLSGTDQKITVHMDTTGPTTQGKAVTCRVHRSVALKFLISDNLSPKAVKVKVTIRSHTGKAVKVLSLPAEKVGVWHTIKWKPSAKGSYTYTVTASDLAGNRQAHAKAGRVKVS